MPRFPNQPPDVPDDSGDNVPPPEVPSQPDESPKENGDSVVENQAAAGVYADGHEDVPLIPPDQPPVAADPEGGVPTASDQGVLHGAARYTGESLDDGPEPLNRDQQNELMREIYNNLEAAEEKGELARMQEALQRERAARRQRREVAEGVEPEPLAQDMEEHTPASQDQDGVRDDEMPEEFDRMPLRSEAPRSMERDDGIEGTQAVRIEILGDAQRLLENQQEPNAYEAEATAEAVAGMIELLGVVDSPPLPEEINDEAWDTLLNVPLVEEGEAQTIPAMMVAGYRETLEGMAMAPPKELARAYFVEGERFRNRESLEKLHGLLTEEHDAVIAELENDAKYEVAADADYECLIAVVKTCENLGLSPQGWINRYADRESAWQVYVDHYVRQDAAGKEVHNELDAKIAELLPSEHGHEEGAFPAQFVCDNASRALSLCNDQASRIALVNRFQEAQKDVPVTFDNFESLLDVSLKALCDVDHVTLMQLDNLVDAAASKLEENAIYHEDAAEISIRLTERRTEWNAALKAHAGVPAGMILSDIYGVEEIGGPIDRDIALDAAATQFTRAGNFADAQQLILDMTPNNQEKAYVKYWGKARTSDEVRQLNPADSAWVREFNPRLQEQSQVAQVLVSGNVPAMIEQAVMTTAALQEQNSDTTTSFASYLQWEQVGQLLDRVEKDQQGGLQAGQELSRTILSTIQAMDTPFLKYAHLAPLYRRLAVTGRQSDYEIVREVILSRPNELNARKAVRLADFALRIR